LDSTPFKPVVSINTTVESKNEESREADLQ